MHKENKTLLIFVLGFISSMAIIPIIEEAINIILAWMEYFKILPSKLVLKGNNELADLQSETQEHDTYAIGFDYPTHEENDDYYNE